MRFLLVISLLILLNVGYAQEKELMVVDSLYLKLTYLQTYLPDSVNVNYVRQEEMLLFLGKNRSIFIPKNEYLRDSIFKDFKKKGISPDIQLMMGLNKTLVDEVIVKNYPRTGEITVANNMLEKYMYLDKMISPSVWKLEEKEKEILGFLCQGASIQYRGRNYLAWFSPEISASDGPYKFSGLPGLIFNIEDSKGHYRFELLSIKKMNNSDKVTYSKEPYTKTSRADFFNFRQNYSKNLIRIMENSGNKILFDNKADEKRTLKRIKSKYNNAIEIEME